MIKRGVLGLFAVFVAMQCFRPEKNAGQAVAAVPGGDLFSRHQAPAEVRRVIEQACYDCHSNRTRYPWYAEIQPGGWLLSRHVRDGKRLLNFSEFGQLAPKRAIRQLEACVDEIGDGAMPLKSYTWIHADARLTQVQIDAITAWLETTATKIEQAEFASQKSRRGSDRLSLD